MRFPSSIRRIHGCRTSSHADALADTHEHRPSESFPTSTSEQRQGTRRRRALTASLVVATVIGVAVAAPAPPTVASSFGPSSDIWIPRAHVMQLPMAGASWDRLRDDAHADWGRADIADQDSSHDVHTLAGALYAVRTGDGSMRDKVVGAIESAIGTEDGGRTLALGRNLTGYVIAADLVGYRSDRFESWLRSVRHEVLPDGDVPFTLITTHERRPNNWGTHAGAARIAVAAYLGDQADLQAAMRVFRGYLGDRSAYADFKFGDPEWQVDPGAPVPINPLGAVKDGVVVDGAIVDDVRRCNCDVQSPAPRENYQWEAMQGIATQASLLAANGYPDVWTWSNRAIQRATEFLYDQAQYPAEGDDVFVLYLVDAGLGTSYASGRDDRPGKSIGYTGWTHATGAPIVEAIMRGLAPGEVACFDSEASPGDGVLVNLTPIHADRFGHGALTSGESQAGGGSNVNFGPGTVDPNVGLAPANGDDDVCFHNSAHARVHLVADQLGSIDDDAYDPARSDGSPVRVVGTQTAGVRVEAGGRHCFAVDGSPGDGAIVNLTPVRASGHGHGVLTSSGAGTRPSSSNVNYRPGTVDPNVAIAPIGSDGAVCFWASDGASVELLVDHLGTIDADSYRPARSDGAPERRDDTRSTGAPVAPGGRRCFTAGGDRGDAALVNLTPVLASTNGHGVLSGGDVASASGSSNVNFGHGTVDPNLAVAPVDEQGRVCFHVSPHASVHLVADVLGTIDGSDFSWPSDRAEPVRRLDTRNG